jgi:predicted nuclease of predicted toxin-antitoxin system
VRIRFQADADLNPAIGRGLVRREPTIDWRPAQRFIPDATPDPEVLQFAAADGRVLVSRDVTTVPRYFAAFVATRLSPGVILIPSDTAVGEAIERLLMAWLSWAAEDMKTRSGGCRAEVVAHQSASFSLPKEVGAGVRIKATSQELHRQPARGIDSMPVAIVKSCA